MLKGITLLIGETLTLCGLIGVFLTDAGTIQNKQAWTILILGVASIMASILMKGKGAGEPSESKGDDKWQDS